MRYETRNSFPPGCVEYVGRGSSNVYVELAIGLLVLRGLKQIAEGLNAAAPCAAGTAAVIGGGCLAARVFEGGLRTWMGFLIISLFYLLRGEAHCPGDVLAVPRS